MKELIYVALTAMAAIFISSTFASFSHTNRMIKATEERIERMKANPSPVYEHYPRFDD